MNSRLDKLAWAELINKPDSMDTNKRISNIIDDELGARLCKE